MRRPVSGSPHDRLVQDDKDPGMLFCRFCYHGDKIDKKLNFCVKLSL